MTSNTNAAATPVSAPDPRIAGLLTTIGTVPLTLIENQDFRNQDVYLDGRHFRACSFVNCRIFVQLGHFHLENPRVLANNAFELQGPAGTVHELVQVVQDHQAQ